MAISDFIRLRKLGKDKICVCFLCFLGIVSAAVLKCGSPVCVELYSFEERLILYGKISQKEEWKIQCRFAENRITLYL